MAIVLQRVEKRRNAKMSPVLTSMGLQPADTQNDALDLFPDCKCYPV